MQRRASVTEPKERKKMGWKTLQGPDRNFKSKDRAAPNKFFDDAPFLTVCTLQWRPPGRNTGKQKSGVC